MTVSIRAVAALSALALLSSAGAGTAQSAPPQAAAAPPAATGGCPDEIRHDATREQAEFTSEGHTIRGLIYKPHHYNGAAVVLLHGAQGLGGDAPKFDPHAIQLASRGYVVLVPSYFDSRPWQQRRVTSRDMDAWAQVGADAVRYVGGLPNVDPARVALWGYSYGGYLAVDDSVRPDAPAAVAIGVGAGTDIWSDPTRGRREVPILLIHGRADPRVRPNSMRDLAANLRLRGATVEIEMIDTNEHDINGPLWCEVFRYTRGFLDAHLLPAQAAAPAAPATPAG